MIRQLGAAVHQAGLTVRSHPLRSILTALTVTFGTAVLLVLVSYGSGVPGATGEVLKSMGSTQIKFTPNSRGGPGGSRKGKKIQIRYDDIDAIREACPSIGLMAAGFSPGMGAATYGPTRSWPWASMKGVGNEYLRVADLEVLAGRWFTADEETARARVAVLNLPLVEGLFPGESPIGQWVETRGRRFEIIGVMHDAEAFSYSFYVPYTACLGLGDENARYVGWLSVKPKRPSMAKALIGEMKNALGSLYRFDPDDSRAVRVEEQTAFIDQVDAVSTGLQWLVMTIAAVALALGCLGAANVVGITVAERTSEIGLRKALGATPTSIAFQILSESLILCLFGGVLGVALGVAGVRALGPLALSSTVEIAPRADVMILGFGLAVLVVVGTVAGLPAASRAASLDPAESLRSA